ncbi:MAG: threonine--tRNA ligase [bacterium]|nr:threonine--tRNA ligase [bacterium]
MNEQELNDLRHSCAHLLAAAVMEIWPHAKRTIGPAIENGFYFDFDFGNTTVTEKDFPKIEKRMKQLLTTWKGFERHELNAEEAKAEYPDNTYKHELIDEFTADGSKVSFYKSGAYWDLCRGGHCKEPNTALKNFKLLSIAGAYWRGDENNPMLTRIYGTCFESQEELDAYLTMMEEAKKRDHRKLGQELDLFTHSELVGSGLPLFTPRGTIVREQLSAFVWELMKPHGYSRVHIPHMAKSDLYKTSGHWDKFMDDIFHIRSKKTDQDFVMKPMNCPHHTQIYAARMRSYRDLPLRYSEVTSVYRDENTGQLQGLSRVRSITQDDAHVFCRMDQVKQEALAMYDIITRFYAAFNMSLRIRLSTSDPDAPEKYLGGEEVWDNAVGTLKEILQELEKDYEIGVGEAAFYGPKLDFIAKDAIGRDWQLATIQLDFNLPERFALEYIDENNEKVRPVMLHRAILGSIERFMAVLIEHYAGAFPMWLAPEQVRLVPVSDDFVDLARTIETKLRERDIRVSVDASKEGVGKKIRNSAMMKTPWTIVIGEKEAGGGDYQVNIFGQDEDRTISQGDLVDAVLDAAKLPV